jgi:hypothetical protein
MLAKLYSNTRNKLQYSQDLQKGPKLIGAEATENNEFRELAARGDMIPTEFRAHQYRFVYT